MAHRRYKLTIRSSARRLAAGAVALLALAAVLIQVRPAQTISALKRCGLTTLDGTIVFKDGKLTCGPGQSLAIRDDLQKPKSGQFATPILSFVALTDFQLPDEESPLRGEFTDKCTEIKTKSAFRLNDTLLPALINSQIRAASQIAAGPVTGRPFDFAVQLGDASENQQYNEVRAFIDLLDGGTLVDPDSGADGYEGNQGRDPYPSPVQGTRLVDLANEPFWAAGLRRADGSQLPWYSVMGNHDAKVRGTVPNDNGAWRTFARAWVTGGLMVNDLAPDQQARVCEDPSILVDPLFWAQIAAQPGSAKLITADPDRRLVNRQEWMTEHSKSAGLPAGHGPTVQNRCKDGAGRPLERTCYTFDLPPAIPGSPPIHFIALDTTPDEGLDEGNLDQAQWNWLNKDLKDHSACFYESDNATTCTKTGNTSSLIVVFSHHTAEKMTNDTPRADAQTSYQGDDLTKLFLRFPNMVAHVNGHTHYNKVYSHQRGSAGSGYWEIATSAIADFPHQSRTIEIADNHDGTLSIYGINFDAAAPVDPATIRWADDATPETSARFGGAKRNINEEHLASIARWVGANDPQSGAASSEPNLATAQDKNVELLLKHPTGGTKLAVKGGGIVRPRIPRFVLRPRFPFGGFPFPFPTNRPRFPQQPPRIFPTPPTLPGQFDQFATTGRGIGVPATSHLRLLELFTTGFAIFGAFVLIRARVRRNMLGL